MDMLHGYMLLRSAKSFHGVSERYSNALADKVNRAQLKATKADELAYSTQTGFGDEWAPDLWSQQIWHKARQDNTILPLFQSIEMPSNPFELPIEGADPTVYFVPETQDEAHLTLGSGNPIPGQQDRLGQGDAERQEAGAAGRLQQRTGRGRRHPGAEYLPRASGPRHRRRHRQRAAQRRHHHSRSGQYQQRQRHAGRHRQVPGAEWACAICPWSTRRPTRST